MRTFKAFAFGTLFALSCGFSGPAFAAAKYLAPGFTLPQGTRPSVLVVYPGITINRQGANGTETPDDQWIAAAHANFESTLKESKALKSVDLRFMSQEDTLRGKPTYDALMAAFRKRIGEIIFKVPQGSQDITKAKKCKCTYDMAGFGDKVKAEFGAADYALMIVQYDTYASTGQILGEIAGAAIGGLGTPQGSPRPMRPMRIHAGNAMLFDLQTGAIVWFHGDGAFGGDLRDRAGAAVRLGQALTGFPAPR